MTDGRAVDVSVLIVSWNTRELTEACLGSLAESVLDGIRYEVIVVDNGSTDGSLELLRARPEVLLVENGENLGYAAAVNQAFARASGRLVLLLNSDIVFKPHALSALVRFLEERPDVAGVGPLYLNPDGSPQQHHFRLPTLPMLLASSSRPVRLLPAFSRSIRRYEMSGEDFSHERRVEQPSASVLLLRRSALPAGPLLDEGFPIYFNDVDLAWRLRRSGHELWFTPESEVFHVHGASTRLLGTSLRRQHLASLVGYLTRTQPRRNRVLFISLMIVQKTPLAVLRRPGALSLRDLFLALRGDPGPLPQAPSRTGSSSSLPSAGTS